METIPRLRFLLPCMLLVLACLSPALATDARASVEDCREICAEDFRRCYQDGCAEVDDEDSLCARRCKERRTSCEEACDEKSGGME